MQCSGSLDWHWVWERLSLVTFHNSESQSLTGPPISSSLSFGARDFVTLPHCLLVPNSSIHSARSSSCSRTLSSSSIQATPQTLFFTTGPKGGRKAWSHLEEVREGGPKKSLCMGSLEADNGMRILKVIVFRKSCEKGCIEEDGSSSFDAPLNLA